MTATALPLTGIRVIELCWVWSGPLLGQYLADLGAEVIKVEWYKRYDLYRTRGVERMAGKYPDFIRREMSQSFHGLNRNKIGVTLDLKDEIHRDALLELAKSSHLVIENFTAGTLDRLGLGFDKLKEANPQLVLLSLSGFGLTSRLAAMRAYGLVLSALSGIEASILDPKTGDFIGSPTFVASDPNAATYGLFAAITAMQQARRTGYGAHVEISQLEAIAHAAADKDDALKELAGSLGLDIDFAPRDPTILRTADDQYLCVLWPAEMVSAETQKLADLIRQQPIDMARTAVEAAGGQAVRIIEKPAEVGAGAADAGTLISTIHPTTGPENIVAAPWWIDGSRPPLRKTAPLLGEGNDYVLGTLLGWNVAQRRSLIQFDMERSHGS